MERSASCLGLLAFALAACEPPVPARGAVLPATSAGGARLLGNDAAAGAPAEADAGAQIVTGVEPDAGADLQPPSQASCDKFRRETRLPPITPSENRCCPPEGTGCILPADCEEPAYRVMVRRVISDRATTDDVRALRALCRHKRDAACLSCAEWLLRDR